MRRDSKRGGPRGVAPFVVNGTMPAGASYETALAVADAATRHALGPGWVLKDATLSWDGVVVNVTCRNGNRVATAERKQAD